MAFAAAAVVPFGLLFLSSGLVVNLFQAILFVLIYPFSKSTYREINKVIAELLWLEFVWLFDWRAGVKIELYGDPEAVRLMGKEHALFISNHRSDVDWLVGWILAERSGCLGSTLAVMKKSLKFLPVFGWSMWFSEYLFLERNWAKDEETLKSGLERLKDFPRPFWLALFVEGTRFTETKLLAAQEYAASAGLSIPRNVLIPRTKGFVSAVTHMRSFVPAIYEATVAIPNSQPPPTMLGLLKGNPSTIRLHVRRHAMEDLPDSEPELARWCHNAFLAKDDLLDLHASADTFSGHTRHHIGRPVRSLAVVVGWCSVLAAVALKVLHACYVSSSWSGIIITSAVLAVVTLLTHVLIAFSQSDRSSPRRRH